MSGFRGLDKTHYKPNTLRMCVCARVHTCMYVYVYVYIYVTISFAQSGLRESIAVLL